MKDKKIEKQIKLLARQKKYEQIYQEYGPYYFRKYVSNEYKQEEIERLGRERKYLEIYKRYGETYGKINEDRKNDEVKEKEYYVINDKNKNLEKL